jgi:hypothetical protein
LNISRLVSSYKRLYPFASVCKRIIYCLSLGYDRGKKMFGLWHLLHGRADKKFCNDLCRNNYNNQLNSNSYNLVRNINNILRRNRRIIEELNPTGKTKTNREKMLQKGSILTTLPAALKPRPAHATFSVMNMATCYWIMTRCFW